MFFSGTCFVNFVRFLACLQLRKFINKNLSDYLIDFMLYFLGILEIILTFWNGNFSSILMKIGKECMTTILHLLIFQ